ncbi:unnamed protein product [[Candida] boidinii]|nr:unnamed protein product [[Candida] boidinii]
MSNVSGSSSILIMTNNSSTSSKKETPEGLVISEVGNNSNDNNISSDDLTKIENSETKHLLGNTNPTNSTNNVNNANNNVNTVSGSELYEIETTLSKEEFVVGMWLVDQCLYGKKLPKFISSDVWESVEIRASINIIPSKKHKHHHKHHKNTKILKKVVGISH